MKLFCKFVEQSRFRRNPKTNFIYNKELPAKGDKSERLVYPFLERDCNSKVGDSAYKNFFYMQSEKNFVTGNKNVSVTPAQLELLELLNHVNAADFAHHVKEVHELGTYFVTSKDLVNLSASLHVHWLYDAISAIAKENFTNLKSA